MIQTEEYPMESWEHVLNDLSLEAREHLMSVRIESAALGDQILAEGLPLVGISLETKGSERGAIEIIAARSDGTHLTHMIQNPKHLYLARWDDGSSVCLNVEDADGGKTLLFVHEGPLK